MAPALHLRVKPNPSPKEDVAQVAREVVAGKRSLFSAFNITPADITGVRTRAYDLLCTGHLEEGERVLDALLGLGDRHPLTPLMDTWRHLAHGKTDCARSALQSIEDKTQYDSGPYASLFNRLQEAAFPPRSAPHE